MPNVYVITVGPDFIMGFCHNPMSDNSLYQTTKTTQTGLEPAFIPVTVL